MQDDLSPITRQLIALARKQILAGEAMLIECERILSHSRRNVATILANLGVVDQMLLPESERRL